MTEHAAVIFVFFFLAEYASIVLMCLLVSILFLGGYNFDFTIFAHIFVFIYNIYDYILDFVDPANSLSDMNPSDVTRIKQLYNEQTIYDINSYFENLLSNPAIENLIYALVIGIKTSIMIFVFI
jgi:NADH-ubiquinone oxidoreductase chain 1